jgi:predicted transcriptional regulator
MSTEEKINTSRNKLIKLIKNGTIETQLQKTLFALMSNNIGMNKYDASKRTGITPEVTSKRLTDLHDLGLIYQKGERDDCGVYYFEPSTRKQTIIARERESDRVDRWIKRGIDEELITYSQALDILSNIINLKH